MMKNFIILALALFAFYQYIFYIPSDGYISTIEPSIIPSSPIASSIKEKTQKRNAVQNKLRQESVIDRAFKDQRSRIQVESYGRVIKVLRDDLKGSRHQRFIVRIASGITVLIAHNIDLAPRIQGISEGDRVHFYGQYEWNNKGGVIHWTHKDPRNRHTAGWIKHQGRIYQ